MPYKHGVYAEIGAAQATSPASAGTVAVYVGTAPVHLLADFAGSVNKPVRIRNLADAKALLGYDASLIGSYSLCEAVAAHFENAVGNAGPIYCINVLDPATAKGTQVTKSNCDLSGGSYMFAATDAIVSTVRVTGKVLGTDYTVAYVGGKVVITALTAMTATETVTYYPVDMTDVTKTEIIGAKSATGNTGLYAIADVYAIANEVPSLLAAPAWSEVPDVYTAMLDAASDINGHWQAFVVADIPVDDDGTAVDTIAKAIAWKATNGYTDKRSKVCWPQVQTAKGVMHSSTVITAAMVRTDAENAGIPMESASNKACEAIGQYFGAGSATVGYEQTACNELNADGITTVCFWGGVWLVWGDHTAAYKYGASVDEDAIFDVSMRMLFYIANGFQARHGIEIDRPMTVSLKDSIINAEQAELDRLVGAGAIIGTPYIVFEQSNNPMETLVQGDFVFDLAFTATPPLKSATLRVSYNTDGFAAYFEQIGGAAE